MSENLPATQDQQQPFQGGVRALLGNGINHGAVAIESERAIAEAQGKLTLAKKFPRSMAAAISDFLEACSSPAFAATAFYSVPNRGSGPSIRFAEEAARCYGNFVYGHKELSRSEGKSEIVVYAWDMEKNNESPRQITVMHITDTKNGPKKLTDQNDIDNRIANVASKQMRGRILALMPKHMIAAGIEACKLTLAGGSEKPISERILGMVKAFGKFGVNTAHLEAHLSHKVDDTTTDELADLMGIYNAIKDGAKASDFFKLGAESDEATASTAAKIASRAAAGAAAPAAKAAAAKPAKAAASTAEPEQKSKTTEPESNSTKAESAKAQDKQPEPSATPATASAAEDTGPDPVPPADDDVF